MNFTGWDKRGRPITYMDLKKIDTKIVDNFTVDDIWRYAFRIYEIDLHIIYPYMTLLTRKRIEDDVLILNLNGFDTKSLKESMTKPIVKKILKIFSKMSSDFYPGSTTETYVINCPPSFLETWDIVKIFYIERRHWRDYETCFQQQ